MINHFHCFILCSILMKTGSLFPIQLIILISKNFLIIDLYKLCYDLDNEMGATTIFCRLIFQKYLCAHF